MTAPNPDLQDIRTWAQGQGLDVAPKGKIPLSVMEAWNGRETPPGSVAAATTTAGEVVPEGPPGGDSGETRPAHQGIRPFWKKPKGEKGTPRSAHRRVSTENIVAGAWGLGAWAMSRNPMMLPTARVLDMQAPVAGVVINDVTRGTVVDKVLQPLARMEEKGGKVGALVGPPILVGLMTSYPALHEPLRPVLKMALMTWMEVSEPAMKKLEARAKRFEDKVGASAADIEGMIDALFAPPPADMYVAPADGG